MFCKQRIRKTEKADALKGVIHWPVQSLEGGAFSAAWRTCSSHLVASQPSQSGPRPAQMIWLHNCPPVASSRAMTARHIAISHSTEWYKQTCPRILVSGGPTCSSSSCTSLGEGERSRRGCWQPSGSTAASKDPDDVTDRLSLEEYARKCHTLAENASLAFCLAKSCTRETVPASLKALSCLISKPGAWEGNITSKTALTVL